MDHPYFAAQFGNADWLSILLGVVAGVLLVITVWASVGPARRAVSRIRRYVSTRTHTPDRVEARLNLAVLAELRDIRSQLDRIEAGTPAPPPDAE